LGRVVGIRIVGEALILTLDVRVFRLDEEWFANRLADCRLVVMAPLIRSIDSAKAGSQR
jgi:hypothetical protein